MSLAPGCPRCAASVTEHEGPSGGSWSCTDHGPITPLWRPGGATYDAFGELLRRAGSFPTYLPWPMSPGWTVSDFGVVADAESARATVTCSSGTSDLDGPVDVFVVTEEAGTGLGGRVAGIRYTDPDVGAGPPTAKVRIGSQAVSLWGLSTVHGDHEVDRSVVAGEAAGRWLWMVVRPASAILLLRDDWLLRDVGGMGPMLLDMGFGGVPPAW